MLIFDPTRRDIWSIALVPTDPPVTRHDGRRPRIGRVTAALRDRGDLIRARKDYENAQLNAKYADNQRLPDVRLNASYQANGLGGTEVLRDGGFPGIDRRSRQRHGVRIRARSGRCAALTGPGRSASACPIRSAKSAEEATLARTQLQEAQTAARIKSAEGQVIQQIRNAAWQIDMNARRIDASRAARELAEQRLDAERKRMDVGLSTSFLVIQAQRDLAQARNNELAAVLAYDLALVDFEELVGRSSPAPQISRVRSARCTRACANARNASSTPL